MNKRIWLIAAALLMCCIAAGVIGFSGSGYSAQEEALACIASPAPGVEVFREEKRLVFAPAQADCGLVFYPGGSVEMESYAPLMEAFAQKGIFCVLLEMPMNLAILDMDAAKGVPEDYPSIERWYIGGHSLGGYAASTHLAKMGDAYEGLILLAAYTQSDFKDSGVEVLTIYGSEDGVLNMENYEKGLPLLPAGYEEIVIDGGCHAYFGAYGAQDGDGVPTITREEQMAMTADAVAAFMR